MCIFIYLCICLSIYTCPDFPACPILDMQVDCLEATSCAELQRAAMAAVEEAKVGYCKKMWYILFGAS